MRPKSLIKQELKGTKLSHWGKNVKASDAAGRAGLSMRQGWEQETPKLGSRTGQEVQYMTANFHRTEKTDNK